MKNPPVILTRSLCATAIPVAGAAGLGEVRILSVLPHGRDGRIARLYLMDLPERMKLRPAPSAEVIWTRVIDGAPVADMLRAADGTVGLPVEGVRDRVPVAPDECVILADRDVIVGHMNREPVTVLHDWLAWHRSHHGATGALVLTRGVPGTAETTANALSALIANRPDTAALEGMVILLVDCDQPLGLPDRPDETHLLNAPDAPGKDRMAQASPDPWHAPLGYGPLFDLLRHRFLAQAAGVASLEVIDLVAEAPRTMFDEARAISQGLIPLRGRHAYPWNLRKNKPACFGDHICTRFDAPSYRWRWCLVPHRMPEDAIWMRDRILGASGPHRAMAFHRCMALRHGRGSDAAIGQMVPKTSLVEDPILLDRAGALGVMPLRPPQTRLRAPGETGDLGPDRAGTGAGADKRVLIVTTMKNEGPFILEWLAYHRAIGVTDFLIYTNDCSDGTDTFLQLLQRKGLCQWRDNPYRQTDMKPQHAALDAANDEPILAETDWAICMDVDEFIAVHVGDGTLAALFDAIGEANMISLTWRLFGNADIDGYRDSFITQDHTLCAREFTNKPHQAWGFKTLYRNLGLFRKMGVHRPKGMLPAA
ncbi:MAG: glycosyltransferase family 2 protein, partial [Paracoccus sp. (in: a-proteobacteria)]|nr:glycosyltransferase family 2 protein [Paracoccus sp. (in: a-proteobacteria)]